MNGALGYWTLGIACSVKIKRGAAFSSRQAAGESLFCRAELESPMSESSCINPLLPAPMTENPTAESPFGSAVPHDPFQAAKASAMKAAEELRAAAAQKVTEFRSAAETRAQQFRSTAEQRATDIRDKAEEIADQTLNQARVRYDDLRAEAEKFAREKPLQALLTAFGIGFVVGAILRR